MIYIIATPIGNLKDITLRALEALEESDYIFCEDTRNSGKLLNHYDIKKKLISLHEHNELQRSDEVIDLARQGNTISFISDAGMPGISDPGSKLIEKLIEEGIEYTVLPGPSAFTTALVYSGLNSDTFRFMGFLPVKGRERKEKLSQIENDKDTLILYEAPHKLDKTMEDLAKIIPERRVSVVRELTKIYESATSFLAKDYKDQEIVKKGEIVIIIDKDLTIEEVTDDLILKKLEALILEGSSKKEAASIIAKDLNLSKNRVYNLSKNL